MITFFDVETTGLPKKHAALTDPCQPHIVQMALLLTEDDGAERVALSVIVNPGVPIPEEASRIHGITNEIAEKFGIQSATAVNFWWTYAKRASLIVAHNLEFDEMLMEISWARANHKRAIGVHFDCPEKFCTMLASAPILNLPPTPKMIAAGFNKPKSPKLEECVKFFFGEDLTGAHDALTDVRACARVYFELKRREKLS
jgi:DNA polymerase-3 subunit epsilon